MIRTLAAACLLALLSPGSLLAQGRSLGVKGGVNLATQRNEGDEDAPGLKSRIGIVAGVFATLPVSSWLTLQPEALFSSKGAKLDLDGVNATLAIDYFEVPVLARISRRGTGRVHYYAAGGPSVGVQLRARSRTKFGSATEELDLGDDVERLDFGVAVGGGVDVGSLVFDGRYTLGLKDIDKDRSDSVKTRNRALSLTAGFRF